MAPQTQPDTQTVAVLLTNNHAAAHEFRLAVIPPQVDGVVVGYENGSSRVFDVASISALPRAVLRNATSLSPVGDNTSSRRFTLDSESVIGTTFEGVPKAATVAYFVTKPSEPTQVSGSGLVNCGETVERTELTITVSKTGEIHAATHCTG